MPGAHFNLDRNKNKMGCAASSPFERALKARNSPAAVQLVKQSAHYPSVSHGVPALDAACAHGLPDVVRALLSRFGVVSGQLATTVHACVDVLFQHVSEDDRVACLEVIVEWVKASAPATLPRLALDVNLAQPKVAIASTLPVAESTLPLHKAAEQGWSKLVTVLVDCGADARTPNVWGQAPADVATAAGYALLGDKLEAYVLLGGDAMGSNDDQDQAPGGVSESKAAAGESKSAEAVVSHPPVARAISFQAFQSTGSILDEKAAMVKGTARALRAPPITAEVLLGKFGFDQRALIRSYIKDPVATCKEAGVEVPKTATPTVSYTSVRLEGDVQSCAICFDDVPTDDVAKLSCGHVFCQSCWTQYLESLFVERTSPFVCPAFRCDVAITERLVEKVLRDDAKVAKFNKLVAASFVDTLPSIKWCVHPDCPHAVRADPNRKRSVTCKAGHVWCWGCGYLGGHDPCDCVAWRSWGTVMENAVGDAETLKLLLRSTKPCPKCKSPIEKNRGCRHMTCRACKHQFCWHCLGDWRGHRGTNCRGQYGTTDQGNAAAWKDTVGPDAILDGRTLAFKKRYDEHAADAKKEAKLIEVLTKHMDHLQDATPDVGQRLDFTFVQDAARMLSRGRSIIGCSIAAELSMSEGLETSRLKNLVAKLEEAVDQLSDITTAPFAESEDAALGPRAHLRVTKDQIQRATDVVRRAVDNLLDAAKVDYQEVDPAVPEFVYVVPSHSHEKIVAAASSRRPCRIPRSLPTFVSSNGCFVTCNQTFLDACHPAVALNTRLSHGRWYFEAEFNGGNIHIGWADTESMPPLGTGVASPELLHTPASASIDTHNGLGSGANAWAASSDGSTWHNGRKDGFSEPVPPGSTIGCSVDIDTGLMSYSVNGRWLGSIVLEDAPPPSPEDLQAVVAAAVVERLLRAAAKAQTLNLKSLEQAAGGEVRDAVAAAGGFREFLASFPDRFKLSRKSVTLQGLPSAIKCIACGAWGRGVVRKSHTRCAVCEAKPRGPAAGAGAGEAAAGAGEEAQEATNGDAAASPPSAATEPGTWCLAPVVTFAGMPASLPSPNSPGRTLPAVPGASGLPHYAAARTQHVVIRYGGALGTLRYPLPHGFRPVADALST